MLYKDRKIFIFIFTKIKMTTFNSYNDVIAYVEKRIPVLFGEVFRSSDLANCSSQLQLISNQTLDIAKGVTVTNCNINLDVNQETSSDTLCVDVTDKLKNLSKEERNRMFDDVLNKLMNEPIFINNLTNRQIFKKEFIEKLKGELHNVSPSAQVSCNSNVLLVQNQKVIIAKDMECDPESAVDITSSAFAYQQMKCLTVPVIDKIKRDFLLFQLFNKGDNQDCIYELRQTQPCRLVNGKLQRDFQAIIIQNKIGNGKCVIKENLNIPNKNINISNQTFVEPCPTPQKCAVSAWGEWTPCYDVKNTDGSMKKMQYRTRQITQQGTDCPKILKEERACVSLPGLANLGVFASAGEVITENDNKVVLPLWFKFFIFFVIVSIIFLIVKIK